MARKKTPARRGGISKTSHESNGRTGSLTEAYARVLSNYTAAAPTHIFKAPDSGIRGEIVRVLPPPPVVPRPSHARPRHTHVFFLPGNPGIIEIYRRWLVETHERLPLDVRAEVTLHGIGLPGFDLRGLNGDDFFSISEMCDYWKAYSRSAQVSPPLEDSRVVFIGHSYGAFLALRILNADMALAARAHVIMLMPAVHQMAECRPIPVRILTDGPVGQSLLVPLVGAALRNAPKILVRSALQRFGVQEQDAMRALERMFDGQRGAVHANALRLAQEEMAAIHHPSDHPSSAAVGPERSFLYWTDGDTWCAEPAVEAIREAFGDLTVEHAPAKDEVAHAFGVDVRHIDAVARTVASWITGIGRNAERAGRS